MRHVVVPWHSIVACCGGAEQFGTMRDVFVQPFARAKEEL